MIDVVVISWKRKTSTGTDELGHRQTAIAAEWPRDVRGDWQTKDGRSVQAGDGRTITRDAVFYSESFMEGAVGDIGTSPAGVEHMCVGVVPREDGAGTVDHVEYIMQRSRPTGETLTASGGVT